MATSALLFADLCGLTSEQKNPMALTQLLYCSTARTLMSDAELDEILEVSARKNGPLGITGLLLYLEGSFIQALEGEEREVMETYTRICGDRRHFDVTLVYSRPQAERDFPDWRMGFHRLNWQDIEAKPAFAELRGCRLAGKPIALTPGLAGKILADFCLR